MWVASEHDLTQNKRSKKKAPEDRPNLSTPAQGVTLPPALGPLGAFFQTAGKILGCRRHRWQSHP